MWRIHPRGRDGFASMGPWANLLLAGVCIACTAASLSLWRGGRWGHRVAIVVPGVKLVGDALNAPFGHDPRAAIGAPTAGALIFYLLTARVRRFFAASVCRRNDRAGHARSFYLHAGSRHRNAPAQLALERSLHRRAGGWAAKGQVAMETHPLTSESGSVGDERQRLLALLQRYGSGTTSFQTLEPGFRYWFDGEDACVAFVETRGAWVVAGAPICPAAKLSAVTARFTDAARATGRRVAFFAAEQPLVDAAGLASVYVGEQPVWNATRWPETVASTRSLREQLRRAENKGVTVRGVVPRELAAATPLRADIERLIERWRRDKPMAPMGFLVDVQPFDFASERRYFVAERDGAVVGFLAAVPIYRRRGWLIEDFLRDPSAPNGTSELLIDAAMRVLGDEGSRYVTLGLAPLSGPVRGWLRAARRLSSTLYDFAGLRAFKAKLRPHAWEPIYLAHAPGSSSHVALVDALAAFARGSFLRFGGATLLRGPALVVRVLAALLVPWTLLLLFADARWFPAPWVQASWVGFDLALVAALFWLTYRWRHWLGVGVAAAVSVDALLTLAQLIVCDRSLVRGPDWIIVAIALTGPALAAVVLWGAVGHRRGADAP